MFLLLGAGNKVYSKLDQSTMKRRQYEPPSATFFGSLCKLSGRIQVAKWRPIIAKLPSWCRPSGRLVFDVHANGKAPGTRSTMRIGVFPNGNLRWLAGARGTYLSLEPIIFPVRNVPAQVITLAGGWRNWGTLR